MICFLTRLEEHRHSRLKPLLLGDPLRAQARRESIKIEQVRHVLFPLPLRERVRVRGRGLSQPVTLLHPNLGHAA